eukprot:GDKJ01054659.1.p1 GENE.GDKJ01054659.1~~GDKJ01054659.1.p1  ORF type:complete len:194 (+),score=35.44 GDKJ01054659.1:24-605(+)
MAAPPMTMQEMAVLQMAEQIERALDDEIDRIDDLDEDDVTVLRRKRVAQLKEMAKRRDGWMAKGHGRYNIISDPQEFFQGMKDSERVVCHFGRGATMRCKIIDKHFQILAQKHYETRFQYVDVEKFPNIAQSFNVVMLPHIMLVEKQNTFHSIIGLDDFGGRDDFSTDRMEEVLCHYGMVNDRDMFEADQSEE